MRKRILIFTLMVIILGLISVIPGQSQAITAASLTVFNETEPNNTFETANGPLNVNTTITGLLATGDDLDWYKVNCLQNNTLSFYLDGSAYYLTGYLYDMNGNSLGTIRFNQTFIFTPGYSGYYYIKISGYPNVKYTLNVTTPVFNESESNNTLNTANGPYNVNMTIAGTTDSSGSDQDWYKISCVKNGSINFYLNGTAYYLSGTIYDNNGNSLGTISFSQTVTLVPGYTGYFYVKISGYPNIRYTLSVTTPVFNESEYNNTLNTANGPINPNVVINGAMDTSGSDEDWYKINYTPNTFLAFYLTGSSYYITGYIYDSNGNSLGTIPYNQNYTFNQNYSGYLYVKITGYPNIKYALNVTIPVFDELESNNALGTANGPISVNTTIVGALDSSGSDMDWYKVSCAQDGTLTFYLNGSTYYITGYIYDNNGNSLGTITFNQAFAFTPSYTGYFYIKISGYPNIIYTLDVTIPDDEGMTILGNRIEDPYSFDNMAKAYTSLKSTSSQTPVIDLQPTHLYLRFLPKNEDELAVLQRDSSITVYDYPLNYEVQYQGAYYHDPSLPSSSITWQYCVVPINYQIPSIYYEVLYPVYIPPSNDTSLKSTGNFNSFYDQLENESMKLTGNLSSDDSPSNGTLKGTFFSISRWHPSGKITVDDDLLGTVPVAGANVHARWSTRVETTLTGSDGSFYFNAAFLFKVNYSIKWERADFNIRSGDWFQAWYNGPKQTGKWNLNIRKGGMSWVYAHIHRAAYTYYYANTWGIKSPPKDGKFLKQRIHIGAMDNDGRAHYYDFNKFILLPQIKVYRKQNGLYLQSHEIFETTIHELAHASHWEMGYGYAQYLVDWMFSEPYLPESWAQGVGKVITSDVYRYAPYFTNAVNKNYFLEQYDTLSVIKDSGGYTPIVVDMIDNFDQRSQVGSAYPIDRVNGYTLAQLETALSEVTRKVYFLPGYTLPQLINNINAWNEWRDKIKELYDNPTEGYLNELFANYK